jgi:hypothetical protein
MRAAADHGRRAARFVDALVGAHQSTRELLSRLDADDFRGESTYEVVPSADHGDDRLPTR